MKKSIMLILALILTLSLAACSGGDTDTPSGENTPTPPPSQSAESDTQSITPPAESSEPVQSQAPETSEPASLPEPIDISEMTLNEEAMSLSAETNADGSITYTYKDTSIKPTYISDGAAEYIFAIRGKNADDTIIVNEIFNVNSQPQNDGAHILDMATLTGPNETTVTIDSDGLTVAWTSTRLEGDETDGFGEFFMEIGLFVGGELAFQETFLPIELVEIS
jgi:uncharacterized lipoprotein YehR (DUF1307 family)